MCEGTRFRTLLICIIYSSKNTCLYISLLTIAALGIQLFAVRCWWKCLQHNLHFWETLRNFFGPWWHWSLQFWICRKHQILPSVIIFQWNSRPLIAGVMSVLLIPNMIIMLFLYQYSWCDQLANAVHFPDSYWGWCHSYQANFQLSHNLALSLLTVNRHSLLRLAPIVLCLHCCIPSTVQVFQQLTLMHDPVISAHVWADFRLCAMLFVATFWWYTYFVLILVAVF